MLRLTPRSLLLLLLPLVPACTPSRYAVVSDRAYTLAHLSTKDIEAMPRGKQVARELGRDGNAFAIQNAVRALETQTGSDVPGLLHSNGYGILAEGFNGDFVGLCLEDPEVACVALEDVREQFKRIDKDSGGGGNRTHLIERLITEITKSSAPSSEVLKGGTFFETVTAIAFDGQLDPVPIPAVAVGFRPDLRGNRQLSAINGVAMELLLGGAFSANTGSSSTVDLALGAGFTFPIGENASFAVGYIRWNPSDGDRDDGMYIGLTFGPRPKPQPTQD